MFFREAILHQREIHVFIAAVDFIADDRMTEMCEVNANLMFASSEETDAQEGEISFGAREFLAHGELGLRGQAIGAHAILHCHAAGFVFAQGRVDQAFILAHMAMNNGEVFLIDGAIFPEPTDFAGSVIGFGHKRDAAGFAIKAVDKMNCKVGLRGLSSRQIEAHAADEARILVGFRGMTHEARGFVDDEQVVILVDDWEKFFERDGRHSSGQITNERPAKHAKYAKSVRLRRDLRFSRFRHLGI